MLTNERKTSNRMILINDLSIGRLYYYRVIKVLDSIFYQSKAYENIDRVLVLWAYFEISKSPPHNGHTSHTLLGYLLICSKNNSM
jgi:hypothetical protein